MQQEQQMTVKRRSGALLATEPVGFRLLTWLAVGLWLFAMRGAWAGRNPCEELGPGAQSTWPPASVAAPGAPSSPGAPESGYLMIQVANESCMGRPVYVGLRKVGDLPSSKGQCVRFALPPGKQSVQIACAAAISAHQPDIAPRRTFRISLLEDGVVVSEPRPLFAVRIDGQARLFPPELASHLLELAEQAVADVMDLSEEHSSVEPVAENELGGLLKKMAAPCDPQDFSTASPQLVLLLQALPPVNAGEAIRFGARVYNTAIAELKPAAEANELVGNGAACAGGIDAERLRCIVRLALEDAKARSHSCLRIHAQPKEARVSIRPLAATLATEFEPLGPQGAGASNANPYVERAVFAGAADPQRYAVRVEAPRFVAKQEEVPLSPGKTMPRVMSLQSQESALPRPRWRVALGIATITGGFLMGGFGVGALAVNGGPAYREEQRIGTFQTNEIGIGLLIGGLALTAAGTALVAIPNRNPASGETP